LGRLPELVVLGPHGGVEGEGPVAWEGQDADELENVGQVLEAVRSAHAGGELQLDQLVQGKEGDAPAANGGLGRIGNATALGFPSPGYSPASTTSTPASVSRSERLPAGFST
jgi:hypothetical protein